MEKNALPLREKIQKIILEYIEGKKFYIQETKHYPEFLDSFKYDIADKIIEKIKSNDKTIFTIQTESNPYFDNITVEIKYFYGDINNAREYSAMYDSERACFNNHKLNDVKIYLSFPIGQKNKFNPVFIVNTIIHETNHIYDDWMQRTKQEEYGIETTPLFNKKIEETKEACNERYLSNIAYIAYLSLKTETNAFLSTVPNELMAFGVDKNNVQTRSRMTNIYKEFNGAYKDALREIGTWGYNILNTVNEIVKDKYNQTEIPYIKVNDFEVENYRDKLRKFCETKYISFLKKYDKILQYYLDTKEDLNEVKRVIHFSNQEIKIAEYNKKKDDILLAG